MERDTAGRVAVEVLGAVGGAVTRSWPGYDVGAMVRARARVLAEVEFEGLNLFRGCMSPGPAGGPGAPHSHRVAPPSAHSPETGLG